MNKDLVTVIIPVFSNIKYLNDSLKSVIDQTYDNIEIIIVDDGSNNHNEILAICKNLKIETKIIKLKTNMGVSHALNMAIIESNGKYINWLSHDDMFCSTKIEDQINSLQGANDKVSITNHAIININKITISTSNLNKKDFINFKESLLIKDKYNYGTLLVPKKLYENNLFDEKLRYVQDYDMFIKLTSIARFTFVNKILFLSRVHDQQGSIKYKEKWIDEKNKFYINFIDDYYKIIIKKNLINMITVIFYIHYKNLSMLSDLLTKKIKKNNNLKIIIVNFLIFKIIKFIFLCKNNFLWNVLKRNLINDK